VSYAAFSGDGRRVVSASWDGVVRVQHDYDKRQSFAFTVGGQRFAMTRGEHLLTEYSHKYTLADAADIARSAGLALRCCWSDPHDWFSVLLLEPA